MNKNYITLLQCGYKNVVHAFLLSLFIIIYICNVQNTALTSRSIYCTVWHSHKIIHFICNLNDEVWPFCYKTYQFIYVQHISTTSDMFSSANVTPDYSEVLLVIFNACLNSFALFTTTNKNALLVLSLFHSWTHLFVLENICLDVAGDFLYCNRIKPAWACCLRRWILFSKSTLFPCIDSQLTQLILSTNCSSLLRLANFFAYATHILSASVFF